MSMKQLKINGFDVEISYNIDSIPLEYGGTETGVYYSAKRLYEAIGKVENLRISRFLDCKDDDGVTYVEKYKGRYYRTNKITYMFCKELFIKYATWIDKELGHLIKECIENDDCDEVNYQINKQPIKKDVQEVEVNEVPTVAKANGKNSYQLTIDDEETTTHFNIGLELENVKTQTNDEQPKSFESSILSIIEKSIDKNEFDFAKQLFDYMVNGKQSNNEVRESLVQNETSSDEQNETDVHFKFDFEKVKKLDDSGKHKLIRKFIKESTVNGNDFTLMMAVHNTSEIAKMANVETVDLYQLLNKLGVVKRASNCGSWIFIEPKKYEKLATVYKSYHKDTQKVRSYTIKWNGCGKIFVDKFIELFLIN